jgi:hypothetical protein
MVCALGRKNVQFVCGRIALSFPQSAFKETLVKKIEPGTTPSVSSISLYELIAVRF